MLIRSLPVHHPHHPDERWGMEEGDRVLAQLSLWWREAPQLTSERVGVIGHYAASSDSAAATLLEHASQRLRAQGCTLAVGPMDGNTWRSYRFLTERGAEPPFFLEPNHPAEWPQQWCAAGFQTIASYFSAVSTDLAHHDAVIENRAAQLAQAGVQLRPLRLAQLEDELSLLHNLSIQSFASNFLYSPLSLREFVEQGTALRDRLRPELILIAEQRGEPVGFLFGLPDWTQPPGAIDTVIIKTLAVVPQHRGTGLGGWLVAHAQGSARALGFSRVIHALMHESNVSTKVSARYAKIFRRYELFAKRL